MPWAHKKPCCQPGCGALVAKGRCEKHTKQQRAASDAARGPERQFYGTRRWRTYRLWILRQHPFCAACGQPANTVHHIIDRTERPDLAFDHSNSEALCKRCHDTKTGRTHGFGKDG